MKLLYTLIAVALTASIGVSMAQVTEYESYCQDNDAQCLDREVTFVKQNGREPATDAELVYVYQLKSEDELFQDEPLPHKTRAIVDLSILTKK